MGRRADAPGVQAKKGNTNRRKAATVAREAKARDVAKLLTASLDEPITAQPPSILAHDKVAVAIWRDLAPVLAETHRLKPQHRPMFYTFCVYYAQWHIANEALNSGGYTQDIPTVADPSVKMTRINPWVGVRDSALKNCLELSKRFGLTPADEYSLFKDQAAAAASNPWLFGGDDRRQATEMEPVEQPSLIGALGGMDSPPPGTPIN